MDVTSKMNKEDTRNFAILYLDYSNLFKEEKGRYPRYYYEFSNWLRKKLEKLGKGEVI